MKNTILIAGGLGLVVASIYVGLILKTGPASIGTPATTASAVPIVPPVDKLEKNKTQQVPQNPIFSAAARAKAEAPKVRIFQTQYKGGTQIVFDHEAHVKKYGLECIECHHVERCGKCHLASATNRMDVTSGKQAFHENCINCHSNSGGPQKCPDCHKQ